MHRGYVRSYRKIKDWEWYTDIPVCHLFQHLIREASHKDGKWRGIQELRGQLITGLHRLSEETGLSVQQLRTALKKLESTGDITSTATNKYRIITICNYDRYHPPEEVEQQAQQQATQQASNKQATTPKHLKNTKKRKEYTPSFNSFWKMYPRKVGKRKAFEAWEAAECENGHLQDVLKGVESYATYCQRENTEDKFIAHPTTWINQERWTDEYSTTKSEPEYFDPFQTTKEIQ